MKYLTPSFSVGGASESFDEGYERVFGKKRERNAGKRYIYRETSPGVVEAIEVGQDFDDAPRSTGDLGKFEYGCRMPDGTPVRDASDYRKYLKQTGLVPSQEYKQQWADAEKKRVEMRNPESSRSTQERRDKLGRELYRRVKSFRG